MAAAEAEKAAGGGGGGREEQNPHRLVTPQRSLTVPQVVAPDPKLQRLRSPSLPVAATLVADPMLVPPDARNLQYGDFKSKSTDPSSDLSLEHASHRQGGGIGPVKAVALARVVEATLGAETEMMAAAVPVAAAAVGFSWQDVTTKARVLSKPEPQYTEEARKNQITGTVVLRAVFSPADR